MDVPLVSVTNSPFPQGRVKNFAFKGFDVFEAVGAPSYRDSFSPIISHPLALGMSVGIRSWMIEDDINVAAIVVGPTYQDGSWWRSV